jgi:4-amino-4-deoxy-L-arabinose transferase-like glycosyltransferase
MAIRMILALALVLRIAAALLLPDQSALLPDVAAYRETAAQFSAHWRSTNLYQMPLYPLLLAATGPHLGQLAADIVLSTAIVGLVYLITLEIFRDRVAALFAGTGAACYPPLIYFAVVGLSETLFITLVLAAFLLWYRGQFTAAAVPAVFAVLTRPVFDLFAPLLVLVFAITVHRLSWLQTLQRLGVYILIYAALMTPWWLNNYSLYGSFVRLTLGGGTALYAGNNPLNHSGGGNVGTDYDTKVFDVIANPVDRDAALRDAAVTYIADNPGRFLELAVLKFTRLWRPWPANALYHSGSVIFISVASFVPLLILCLFGLFQMFRRKARELAPILVLITGTTAVCMILVGTIRYRLPLEPFLIIIASAAVSNWAHRSGLVSRSP